MATHQPALRLTPSPFTAAAGIVVAPREFAASTRTAAEPAIGIGTTVAYDKS